MRKSAARHKPATHTDPIPTNAPTSIKRCPLCKYDKVLSEFYNDRSRRDGKSRYCRECISVKKAGIRHDQPTAPTASDPTGIYAGSSLIRAVLNRVLVKPGDARVLADIFPDDDRRTLAEQLLGSGVITGFRLFRLRDGLVVAKR